MQKIDWLRKLTSRKLWLSVASFVSMLIIYFTGSESEAQQISALILAGASVLGYVLSEGLADSANNTPQIEVVDAVELITDTNEG